MKIRPATKFDIPQLIEMLKRYRDHSPLACLKLSNEEAYIQELLHQVIAGRGIIFVADYVKEIAGMLIAVRNTNAWDPNIIALNELCYWVDTQYRNTSAGYKLLSKYRDYAQELKDQGQIEYFTISKMVNSPDLNYDRFGFRKLEEMWEQ
jgi:N-acetylglutamate synthase-like GNAT family acetyltransferase